MKTNKLLCTIFFICISFMGISKNADSSIKIEEDDYKLDANCAALIPYITDPGLQCLNNKYTFKWPHKGPNWSLFLYYEWELKDQHGTNLKAGTTINPYTVLYLNNPAATKIRVRSLHGYFNNLNDPNDDDIDCKGPWVTLPVEIVRGAVPITEVTSIGSFCPGSSVKFTALPTSSTHNGTMINNILVKYKWEVYFGSATPASIISTQTNETPWISVPSGLNGYNGTDPIDVFVTPVNTICGDGQEYHHVITPAPVFTPFVKGITKPSKYCSGKSNIFKVFNPMAGTEYRWTIMRWSSNSPTAIGSYTSRTGFEMNKITVDFGQAPPPSPYGVGSVTSYEIRVQGRSGCAPWSAPITTNRVRVSYSNCNVIYNRGSLAKNAKTKTDLLDMDVYPNPSTSGIFNINVSGLTGDRTIQVYDIHGKFIIDKPLEINQSKLNLSNYSRGLYFVKVSDGTHQKTQKIIF